MASVILPQIIKAEQHQQNVIVGFYDQYYVWRAGYDKVHPVEPIRNIRFTHDPDWRSNTLSIQSARDGNTTFWKATHVIVRFALPAASMAWPFLFS